MSKGKNNNNRHQVADLGAKVQKILIPVYGHKFYIDVTKANLEDYIARIQKMYDEFQRDFENIDDNDWDAAEQALKKAFNGLLGDGAYDQIHSEESDVLLLTQTLENVANYLKNRFEALGREAEKNKAQAVINAKRNGNNASQSAAIKPVM